MSGRKPKMRRPPKHFNPVLAEAESRLNSAVVKGEPADVLARLRAERDAAKDMVRCPHCGKGGREPTGKLVITVNTIDSTSKKPVEKVMEIGCVTCDGKKMVAPRRAEMYRREQEMWCRCGNPSGQSNYYGDGQHPEVHKHHYRCCDCGKVTQVG